MIFATFIALVLPFIASAAPTGSPQACVPDFKDSSVQIRNVQSGKIWAVPEHATAGAQISAQSPNTAFTSWNFVNDKSGHLTIMLHDEEHHNLIVVPGWHGNAVLKTVRAKNNAVYELVCESCTSSKMPEWDLRSVIASNCAILNVNTTTLQAQEESAGNIRFDKPLGNNTMQLFDLVAA